MKNTIKKGKIRFLVYKNKDLYTGVCFELGLVEQEKTKEKVFKRLKNGANAMLTAINEKELDETHINKSVSLKYELFWYFSFLLKIKDLLVLEDSDIINFKNYSLNCA